VTTERHMTYEEAADALGRSPEAIRQLAKRRRWRRTLGNDGKARIAIPVETLDAPRSPNDPRSSDRTAPERSPDAPVEPSADARALIAMLEGRVSELAGEVKAARCTIADLTAKAGRVDVLEALVEAEKRRAEELREERDRWHAVATSPGLFTRLRRVFG
jgi:hypothetical protein